MAAKTKDKKELGKSFLERVLAKLPEDKRAGVQDVLLGEEILEMAGESVLLKEDYSTLAQGAAAEAATWKAEKGRLDKWWGEKGEEYHRLKALEQAGTIGKARSDDEPAPAPTTSAPALPADLVRKNDLTDAGSRLYADLATLTTLAGKHQVEFGDALNAHELYAHCTQTGRSLADGYESFVAERRGTKAEQARKREIQEAEERGAKKAREEFIRSQSAPPDAVSAVTASFEHGTLRGLNLKPEEREAKYGVEAAVRGYHERKQKAG